METKVIIIGAGATGLTASIFASKKYKNVIVLERTNKAGKKIMISGGTRCNVLPVSMNFEDYFTGSSKNLMKNVFKSWSVKDCYNWFTDEIGLEMVTEEESNKWFPKSNSALEVRDLLLKKALDQGVKVYYDCSVENIYQENNKWVCISNNGNKFVSEKIIMAAGGSSFPEIGTDGTSYKLIKNLGHKINMTYPALTPLKGKHPADELIAGISLNVELSVKSETKKNKAHRSGFLFTHKGFSGPAVLDLSHYAVLAMEKNAPKPEITINWTGIKQEEWKEILINANAKGSVLNKIKEYLPNRLAESLCIELDLQNKNFSDLKKEERNKLIELLSNYKLNYTGHEGYKKAEVTGGGIPLEEIDTSNMQSKILSNLYLCGEIIDVFGRIGGFNFYWAWVSGRLAGLSC